ncbi:putative secreted protein (Por secretion system target) [Nonlabens ulvanivorans]|uniref:Secreted protein (Por secretion system target) n=3 Tax=Nonlabens ulvanivorans TaxID=906888 RepID=A0ABX5E8M6_NONUL|nr:putative secreted protein (Por secretion system target) [Nonlabens ulvanivorans]
MIVVLTKLHIMKIKLLIIIGFVLNISLMTAQPNDFMVGLYQLTNGTTGVGSAFTASNFNETDVFISVGNTPSERVFTIQLLPEFNGATVSVVLDLSNNEIAVPLLDTTLQCTTAPNIIYDEASAGNNSLWSITSGDNNFTINYTENTMAACGIPTAQATFNLSKINVPAGQTIIPDDNFEQELIALGYDTVLDNLIDSANVSAVNTLDISNKGISDLTGLEAFVALDTLRANDNSIATFNSQLVNNARFVNLGNNSITTVDMSSTNSITYASFIFNFSLQNIDISGAINLDFLDAIGGTFSSINTNNNPSLRTLRLAFASQLTSIDVTQNPLLERLELLSCPLLTGINISQNPQLEYLRFGSNNFDRTSTDYPISSIDFTNNPNLIDLINIGSRITNPDFSLLGSVESLFWENSELTAVNINSNVNLIEVGFANNLLSTINFSQNVLLEGAYFNNNNLSNLDLSMNSALQFLRAGDNNLGQLDLSSNALLTFIDVNNNQLTQLNLNNGANGLLAANDPIDPTNQNFWSFNALNNPALTCIEVSDITYMNSNFVNNIDPTASFNMNCATASIVDIEVDLELFPNPSHDLVNINTMNSSIEAISIYDITGKNIKRIQLKNQSNKYALNIENLSKGQYLLVIDTNNGRSAENFIKN